MLTIINPFTGPKSTRVKQVQKMRLLTDKYVLQVALSVYLCICVCLSVSMYLFLTANACTISHLIFQTQNWSLDVPSGDAFSVDTNWDVTSEGEYVSA
jgi:hypothetical protein